MLDHMIFNLKKWFPIDLQSNSISISNERYFKVPFKAKVTKPYYGDCLEIRDSVYEFTPTQGQKYTIIGRCLGFHMPSNNQLPSDVYVCKLDGDPTDGVYLIGTDALEITDWGG